jgi:LEA14-like dessication related protein
MSIKRKSNLKNILIGAGLLITGVFAYRKFNTVEQIKVILNGFEFKVINVLNSVLKLNLNIINPGLMPVKIESISGEIFINETKLADLFYLQTIQLPGRSSNNVILPINLNNIKAGLEIVNFLQSTKTPKIRIKGKVNTGGASFPFETILN